MLEYLNVPAIDGNLHAVVQALHASMLEFQTTFNQNSHIHGQTATIMPLWDEGVLAWGRRMNYFTRQWILNRISDLRAVWAGLRSSTDAALRGAAVRILAALLVLETRTNVLTLNDISWIP